MRDLLERLKRNYAAVINKLDELEFQKTFLWQTVVKFIQSISRNLARGIGIVISIISENTNPLFEALDNFIITKTGWHLLQNRFIDYTKIGLNIAILGYIMLKMGWNFPVLTAISLIALSQWGEKIRAPESATDLLSPTAAPNPQTQPKMPSPQNDLTPSYKEQLNPSTTPVNTTSTSTATPPPSLSPSVKPGKYGSNHY